MWSTLKELIRQYFLPVSVTWWYLGKPYRAWKRKKEIEQKLAEIRKRDPHIYK